MALLKRGKKVTVETVEVVPTDLQNAEQRLQQNDLVNTSPPVVVPAVVPVAVPVVVDTTPARPVRRKKSLSPALLGMGALGLTGLALGAWYLLGAKQVPPEETALIPSPRRRAAAPAASPAAAAKAGGAAKPGAKPTAKPGAATRPGAMSGNPRRPGGVAQRKQLDTLRREAALRPGRVGIVPPGTDPSAPVFAPSTQGELPRMAPAQGAPTPIQPPYFAEGIPGRRGGRNEIVLAPRAVVVSPAQLKELWNQGAAAKDRGDIPAARRAWGEILRLSPGHPGIQQAIDKLG